MVLMESEIDGKYHFPTLEIERLILREITMEDAPDMLSYLSDEKVAHQMGYKNHTLPQKA